jgi:hypothetical protein
MGAPGHYVLCGKGHEIGVIEDDLYWDEEMFKRLEDLENKECPICGQKAKYNFCHYGDINDCTDVKLIWNSTEKRWIIPKKLEERQKRDLKDHIIKKDRIIKTEKVAKKVGDKVAEEVIEKVGKNVAEKIIWIDGREISQISGSKTQSYQDNLEVKVEGEIYMLNATSVLRMVNEFKFSVVQHGKHKYIVPVEKFENGTYVNMDK